MKPKVQFVLNGFIQLNTEERKELIDAMNEYIKSTLAEKERLEEVYKSTRVLLGPKGEVCPCCGRSK